MQEACLNLASHKAILKRVINDIASGGLHSQNPNIDVFICARAFGCCFCDAKQIASRRGRGVLAIQLSILIDIRPFCVDIGELADKGGISVVAGFLQRRSLELPHDSDFVAGSDESLCVNG